MLGIVRGTETSIHATQRAFAAHSRLGTSKRVSGGWKERAAWAARLSLLDAKTKERAVATLCALDDPDWAVEALAAREFALLPERRKLDVLGALVDNKLDSTRWDALAEIDFAQRLAEPVAKALIAALSRGAPCELAELASSAGFAIATRDEQLETIDIAEALCGIGAESAWIELLTPEGGADVERERLRDFIHAPNVDAWLLEPMGPGGRALAVIGDPTSPLASYGQAVIGGRRQQRWAGVVSPDPLVESGWVGGEALTHRFVRWTLSGRDVVRFVRWIEQTFLTRKPDATPPNRRFIAEAEQTLRALAGVRGGQAEVGTTYRGERISMLDSQTDTECERLLSRFMAA